MGKGGEKNADNKKSTTSTTTISSSGPSWTKREKKISSLSTEELRKWALAYGLVNKSEEGDRENLIPLLVSCTVPDSGRH